MYGYRLTKYDPAHRDDQGAYMLDDWIGVSDIGRCFGGNIFLKEDYLKVEKKYVDTSLQLLSESGIRAMRISNLEINSYVIDNQIGDGLIEKCTILRDDTIVAGESLKEVLRACLREYIWCRLFGPQESYLHFGHDYYIYIGIPKPASAESVPHGMFLEVCESPSMNLDN
jgi:hypothetical protein